MLPLSGPIETESLTRTTVRPLRIPKRPTTTTLDRITEIPDRITASQTDRAAGADVTSVGTYIKRAGARAASASKSLKGRADGHRPDTSLARQPVPLQLLYDVPLSSLLICCVTALIADTRSDALYLPFIYSHCWMLRQCVHCLYKYIVPLCSFLMMCDVSLCSLIITHYYVDL